MAHEKFIFITADDFGYCPERNRAIIDCFLAGGITDTSLMVNANYTQQAVELGLKHKLPMGLHFNMSEGRPVSALEDVKSLVGTDGLYLGKDGTMEAAEMGQLDTSQVKRELTAQIEKFKFLTGRYPGRVDGHQHVHVFPLICDVFAEVLAEFGIDLTRIPHDLSFNTADWMDPSLKPFLLDVDKYAQDFPPLSDNKTIRSSDMFIGATLMNFNSQANLNLPNLKKVMDCLPANWRTLELMVHPGYPNIAKDGGCGAGPDDFSQDIAREMELEFLMSSELQNYFESKNVCKVSWEDKSSFF